MREITFKRSMYWFYSEFETVKKSSVKSVVQKSYSSFHFCGKVFWLSKPHPRKVDIFHEHYSATR